jgi:hypothetical protein
MRSHVPQLRSTNTEHRAPPAPGRRPHTAVGSETAAGATRRGGPRAQPLQAASRLPAIAARALKHPAASPAPAPPPPPRGARLPAPAGALASTRRRRASGGGLFLRPSTAAAFVFSLLRSSRPFLRSRENPLCMEMTQRGMPRSPLLLVVVLAALAGPCSAYFRGDPVLEPARPGAVLLGLRRGGGAGRPGAAAEKCLRASDRHE